MNQPPKKQPLEERFYYEWDLRSSQKIYDKLFSGAPGNPVFKELLEGEKLVIFAYALGRESSQAGLKTAQIRRFYESLLTIKARLQIMKTRIRSKEDFQSQIRPEILNLKPQLAYAKARHQRQLEALFIIVNPLLDTIQDTIDFELFFQFIEAVVAYHKYCGGRD